MNKSLKFYILFLFLLSFSVGGLAVDEVSNFYENNVASTVCEGDSNIIKAGCSVAVGQVVRVTPGILTGVTLDKMGTCYNKYKTNNPVGSTAVVDLNDPCNQIAMFNPEMKKENYAYIQPNNEELIKQSRSGVTAFTTQMEIFAREATSGGLLMDRNYYAAQTFKNVPVLGKAFAQAAPSSGVNKITDFVFSVWTLSRNIAYLILLIGSLGIGITIMLGNTVFDKDAKLKLGVEQAIPRVVIAVILISSSYWIGELILSAILGGGIIQGFAAFLGQALFPTTGTLTGGSWWLGMPMATLVMGVIAVFTASTGGSGIVVIVFALIFAVYRLFLVNFYIIKNIFDLLIFIIYSPFVIVSAVAPSDVKGEAFKQYGAKLTKFIIAGFLYNLINFGSKSLIAYAVLQDTTAATAGLFSGVGDLYGGGISYMLVYLFGLIAFIYILYQADKVDEIATNFSAKLFSVAKDKK